MVLAVPLVLLRRVALLGLELSAVVLTSLLLTRLFNRNALLDALLVHLPLDLGVGGEVEDLLEGFSVRTYD